ncbi:lysophospholipid acyltransferase family protein [Thermodesulfobacteriota bacterium]
MIKSLLIIAWIILDTLVMCICAIFTSLFSRTGNAPHIIGRFWGKSILWASGIKVNVKGLSNLDFSGPCVFMCNHQSNFDILVLFAELPAQFRWIAKAELFKIPLFARAMRGAGYVSIDRHNRTSAIKSIGVAAEKIRNGVCVMIFPEGTRSPDGKIGKFKKGGFYLALDAGVPIVPLVINGTWSIMQKDSLKITPGNVQLSILPPIDTSVYSEDNRDELIKKLNDEICSEFESNKLRSEGE